MKSALQQTLRRFYPLDDPDQNHQRCEWAWNRCRQEKIQILLPEQFPPLLKEISRPPSILFLKGDATVLNQTLLAVVGSRRPSSYGLGIAHRFSKQLACAGFVLVSGLARGIDGVAHTAAVVESSPTVAVLGHGLDRLYPAEHRGLAADILREGGCLLSEYPPGVAAYPAHFPARNRILSGLSLGVLVVEAGLSSGSLITAKHALEQNREVFVVPGPVSESFAGSFDLIQQGAKLTGSLRDVLIELRRDVAFPSVLDETDSVANEPLRCFLREQGVATFNQVIEHQELDLGQALQLIQAGKESGWLWEISPQRYVYVGK